MHTTYDRDGQHCKQTMNRALRTLYSRTTPTEDCRQGARGVRTSILQYNVRTMGQKEPKTYREYGHGDYGDDGADGGDGDYDEDGDCAGKGVDVDIMGR